MIDIIYCFSIYYVLFLVMVSRTTFANYWLTCCIGSDVGNNIFLVKFVQLFGFTH